MLEGLTRLRSWSIFERVSTDPPTPPLTPVEPEPPAAGEADASKGEPVASGEPRAAGGAQAEGAVPRPEPMAADAEARSVSGRLAALLAWPFKVKAEFEEHWAGITVEVDRIRRGRVARFWFFVKIMLLHLRYVMGYLTAGFLVSAPLYLGTHGSFDEELLQRVWRSTVYGLICLVPFVGLIPMTRIPWENMRLPEFKNFELTLTRWASYVAGVYWLVCFYAGAGRRQDAPPLWWFDEHIAWVNLILMFTAWLRIKVQTVIFQDFYALENYDDLVLNRERERARAASGELPVLEQEAQATRGESAGGSAASSPE